MKHNEDLENKLSKVQQEACRIGTASTLSKDQLELLKTYERHNHVMPAASVQSLATTVVFLRGFIGVRDQLVRCAVIAHLNANHGELKVSTMK